MLTACNITGSCVSSRTACLGCGQHLNTQGAARLARIVSQQMQGLFAATLGGAMLPRSGCSGSATRAEHVSMRLPTGGCKNRAAGLPVPWRSCRACGAPGSWCSNAKLMRVSAAVAEPQDEASKMLAAFTPNCAPTSHSHRRAQWCMLSDAAAAAAAAAAHLKHQAWRSACVHDVGGPSSTG